MKPYPIILIVDDEPFNVDYLEQELEDLEYHTISAMNGRDALSQVAQHGPDLILLDIMMPVMDGFAVLAQLKSDKKTRDIPVIVISAMDNIDSVVKGVGLGAEDYLPKPFEPMLLQARIRACLEKKRLRDQELDYLEQVERLTQAALAIENQSFQAESLGSVASRTDALGHLARVFQQMAKEIYEREQRLLQKLQKIQHDLQEMNQAVAETPDVYIPADRRYVLWMQQELPQRTQGAALFVDISGFTALTEALAQDVGPKRGAEELMRHLNHTYELIIAQVHHHGGSVINFAGDAITCWFDDLLPVDSPDATWRVATCAWQIQQKIKSLSHLTISSGRRFSLAVKAVVVAGPVCRFLVGKPDIQRIEVLAGDTIHGLSVGELLAEAGEILLHRSVVQHLGHRVDGSMLKEDSASQQQFTVLNTLLEMAPASPWPEMPPHALSPEQLRPWLLDVVFQHVHLGQSSDLAELRTVSALFLKFSGIHYEQDPQAQDKLDRFLGWVQEVVLSHDGYVLQFTTGDKGSYLYATFGAPVACEHDAIRAVSAAQNLRTPPADLAYISSVQIGLARGQMRTGPYGSPLRRTYGAVGDQTNLAARLMMLAKDSVLCDSSIYQMTKDSHLFEPLPVVSLKGKSQPVALFRLVGSTIPHIRSLIDTLAPGPHLALKLASVLGEVFTLTSLQAIHPVPTEKPNVEAHLQELLQHQLLRVETEIPVPTYRFHLPVVRNVVYERMLFSQRRQFHAAFALWLEQQHLYELDAHFSELIHHWEQAEDMEKVIHYLEQAGQQAHQRGELGLALELLDKARVLHKGSSWQREE